MTKFFSQFLLLIFLVAISARKVYSQRPRGVVTYTVETVQGYSAEDQLEDKLKECTTRADSLKIEEVLEDIRAFLAEHKNDETESCRDTITYHFNKKKARIIGGPTFRSESFELIDFAHHRKEIWRFYHDDPYNLRLDTMFYAETGKGDVFRIDIQREVRKQVLGFDAYLVNVEVTNERKRGERKEYFEIYMSDEVVFPASALFNWPKTILSGFPVSATVWIDDRRNYTHYELVGYNKIVKRKMFKVPRKFRKK